MGADAGTHARRRSSGASGSTLSMILSPSHARRPNTRRRLFSSSSSSVNVGARTREGEAERAELDRSVAMERVSFWSMFACLAGYLAVGVFAYAEHPDVPSNLLDAYPADDLPMLAASLFMGLSCVASYPINHFASRAALDDLYVAGVCAGKRCFAKTAGDDDSGVTLGPTPAPPGQAPVGRHCTQTAAFVASTAALALAVDDLGVVFQVVGATAGAVVIFILPGILLLLPGYHGAGCRGAVGGAVGVPSSDESRETSGWGTNPGGRWNAREGREQALDRDGRLDRRSRRAHLLRTLLDAPLLNAGTDRDRTAAWKEPGWGGEPDGAQRGGGVRWRWCAWALAGSDKCT